MSAHTLPYDFRNAEFPANFRGLNIAGKGYTFAAGTTKPTDALTGFAAGCIFFLDDDTANEKTYVNIGDEDSCSFVPVNTGATGFIPIPLFSLRETSNFDVGAIAANGGVLASDTTPILEAIDAATDGCQRVHWAADDVDQVIAQVVLPLDLDPASDMTLKLRAGGGATDGITLGIHSFFNEADTKLTDALVGSVNGAAFAEYYATIAADGIPAAARTLTIGLTPGVHATDPLYLTALWLEYTKKFTA